MLRLSSTSVFGAAWRAIVRQRASSAILIFTIALGIGASTAIFSVVDAVLLRPLPFDEPTRLANIWALEANGFSHPGVERDVAEYWAGRADLFKQVESFADRSMLYKGNDEPTEVRSTFVSRGLFALLGVRAEVGRTLMPDDHGANAPDVAVVSNDFFRTRLGARRENIGRAITLDDRAYVVVGVMPAWFRYPLGKVSFWLPMKPGVLRANEQRTTNLVARIRDDLTPAAAQSRSRQLAAQLDSTTPRPNGWAVSLFFLGRNEVNRDVRTALWVLAGAVLSLLLIACANAANILLVRAVARQRELSIRNALGATRGILVRQLITESLCLAILGGLLGVVIAYWGVDLLLLIIPPEMTFLSYSAIDIDARVLAFALGTSLLTGVVFGAGPALRASRAHGTFLTQERSATNTRGTSAVRSALIVAEVALSLVLLVGASLFVRSFIALTGVNAGFDVDRIVTVELSIPVLRYPDAAQRAAIMTAYRDRLLTVPGVSSVAMSTGAPPRAGVTFADAIQAEGGSAPLNRETMPIPFTEGDTAYFSTLGIRLTRGRAFDDSDRRASDRRAVIDQDLARALWPTSDAVGKRFRLGPDDPWVTVVGVAADVKLMGPDDAAGVYGIYFPLPERPRATRFVNLIVRMNGDPRTAIQPIKQAIWAVDPQQPIGQLATARDQMADALAKPRFILTLMGVFAVVALGLAVIGLYGVLSHLVTQRTREIGIRMALGARSQSVMRMVLGLGAKLTTLGIVVGAGFAVAGGRLVRSLLFGVAPTDAGAMAGGAVILAVAALAASYVPARRATQVDPLVALRSE